MKLNNKGITLTEIIISIALISIVLIFLFSLLVTVNDINEESEVNSTYLVSKSLILKNIEEDLSKTTSLSIKSCNIIDFFSNYGKDTTNASGSITKYYYSYKNSPLVIVNRLKGNTCLQFDYGTGDPGYLGIYYHNNRNSYVISYVHGNIKATRDIPDFEKYNVDEGNYNKTIMVNNDKYDGTAKSLSGFSTITIPIIGSDEKDYSIIISYYGE